MGAKAAPLPLSELSTCSFRLPGARGATASSWGQHGRYAMNGNKERYVSSHFNFCKIRTDSLTSTDTQQTTISYLESPAGRPPPMAPASAPPQPYSPRSPVSRHHFTFTTQHSDPTYDGRRSGRSGRASGGQRSPGGVFPSSQQVDDLAEPGLPQPLAAPPQHRGRSRSSGNSDSSANSAASSVTSTRCRRSTSDLTDLLEEECGSSRPPSPRPTSRPASRPASPSPGVDRGPRRAGSVKASGGGSGVPSGNLAYLASRRGSRDSQASLGGTPGGVDDCAPPQGHPRARQRRTSNFLELPVPDHIRSRVCSLPEKPYNPRSGDDLYRLRTFSITNKGGVVNCGDSIINRRSRSNTSVNSAASRASGHSGLSGDRSPFDGSCCGSSYNNVSSDTLSQDDTVTKYRVVLLGDAGVGKTALVSQFMTSEYMNTYDASLDDEFGEKSVSVLLDGEESEMVFIDHPCSEMSVENSLSTYEPHACVVVYSIVQRETFRTAEEILNYLWREHYTHDKAVILVGNKVDLARSRVITSPDGKALAASRECKFIETSSGIQHNVDELLVGILKQIRLRETRDRKRQRRGSRGGGAVGGAGGLSLGGGNGRLHGSRTSLSLNMARDFFTKICLNDSKSKSCENLHVL